SLRAYESIRGTQTKKAACHWAPRLCSSVALSHDAGTATCGLGICNFLKKNAGGIPCQTPTLRRSEGAEGAGLMSIRELWPAKDHFTKRSRSMSKTLPRKAIIAVSSFNGAIYPGGQKTGLFLTEALHPFEVLVAAGFEVDLASETGTFGFDFNSLTPPFLSGSDQAVYKNPNHPFMVKLKSQLKKASALKKSFYDTFFSSPPH